LLATKSLSLRHLVLPVFVTQQNSLNSPQNRGLCGMDRTETICARRWSAISTACLRLLIFCFGLPVFPEEQGIYREYCKFGPLGGDLALGLSRYSSALELISLRKLTGNSSAQNREAGAVKQTVRPVITGNVEA
jgi:hypothetical protein